MWQSPSNDITNETYNNVAFDSPIDMFYYTTNEKVCQGDIMNEKRDSYKRRYKMRAIGQDGLNVVVSIPRVVIEREAEKRGLTVGEFLDQFKAVAQFDNFEGVLYTFEEIESELQRPVKLSEEVG